MSRPARHDENATGPWRSGVLSAAAWLVTSAGLTGLLLAVGYTVYSAHAEFLGIMAGNLTAAEYLGVAGQFLLGVTLEYVTLTGDVLGGVASHWLAVGATLLLAGAVLLGLRAMDLHRRLLSLVRRSRGHRSRIWELAVLIVLLSGVKAAYLDLPAAHINGVLLEAVECNKRWNLPGRIEHSTLHLWRDIVCARVGESSPLAASCECKDSNTHARSLERRFILGASWEVFLLAAAAALLTRRTRGSSTSGDAAPSLVIGVLAALNVVLVPYYYGKVLYPTIFSKGTAQLDGNEGDPSGHILSVDATFVTMFDDVSKAVVTIPRERIKKIQMTDRNDVVLERIGKSAAPPP